MWDRAACLLDCGNRDLKNGDYEVTVASAPEEIRQLDKTGWQKNAEFTVNGVQMHFYREPKRFRGLINWMISLN